jgi:DNA cross-link repair 1C protein
MESLFGYLCSAKQFAHDKHMLDTESDRLERENKRARYTLMRDARHHLQAMGDRVHFAIGPLPADFDEVLNEESQNSYQTTDSHHASQEPFLDSEAPATASDHGAGWSSIEETNVISRNVDSQQSIPESVFQSQDTENEARVDGLPSAGAQSYSNRRRAYRAARTGTFDAWNEIAIVSAGNNHTEEEVEL